MKVDSMSAPLDVVAYAGEMLADVASRMRFNDVGCVPVIDAGELVGILTERDLTRALADGVDANKVEVIEYMTPDPIVIAPGADPLDAAQLMVDAGIRHLPIAWGHRLLGVMSMRDVVAELVKAKRSNGSHNGSH